MAELSEGKITIGPKLRKLRQNLNLNQANMAAELGISASYLNLLENNARPITVPLLFKLGQTYDVDLREIAEDDSAKLLVRLTEIFSDPALKEFRLSRRDLYALANQHGQAAQSMIGIFDAYETMRDAAYSEQRVDQSRIQPRPVEDVRSFLENSGNFFDSLEIAAEKCRKDANLRPGFIFADLAAWLQQNHAIQTRLMPTNVMGSMLRQFDFHRNRILLSEAMPEEQRLFQLGVQIALVSCQPEIDAIISVAGLENSESKNLLKMTLSNYFSACLMMPYDNFLAAAQETKYDLEQLSNKFGASFEQICHRLTTLNRPGARGIAFFFLRVDEAGHISKRLSGGGVEFAKYGGSCSRWIPHQAFRTPEQIQVQFAELEDAHRLITITKTVSKPRTEPPYIGTPIFAIALGCDARHLKELCYTEKIASEKSVNSVPIGLGCQLCERSDCQHRSVPPIGHEMRFDLTKRHVGLYHFRG